MGWSRPSGQLREWRIIELVNPAGKKLKFSIQDIPEDRYPEVITHMCTIFVKDETTLSSFKTSEDPAAIKVLEEFWEITLKQGMSIAAFDISNENEKPKLAGLNVLTVVDEEFENAMSSRVITHEKMRTFLEFFFAFAAEGNPREKYNVDLYLSAFGLSVHPEYRRLGLAKHLLETRNDIGRVYNFKITETVFTSAIAQRAAAAAGFEDLIVRDYDDIVDENGEKLFPTLKGQQIKLMIKKLV